MEETLIKFWQDQKVAIIAVAALLVVMASCLIVVDETEQAVKIGRASCRERVLVAV